MIKNRFMRIILFFDLPITTVAGKREYRRLCINTDSARTVSKRLMHECPKDGDIRFIIITESQYQSITNVNESYSLQESITTTDRCIVIGGMNDEN